MILSNKAILAAIDRGDIKISGLSGTDPKLPPFDTTAVDLRLSDKILIPRQTSILPDLRSKIIGPYLSTVTNEITITPDQPYHLAPGKFILGNTMEEIDLRGGDNSIKYAARVEGKSSLARRGLLIHFTAPTIHCKFFGTIVLEIINFFPDPFILYPGMPICQLIFERVEGDVIEKDGAQFTGQKGPKGR